MDLHNAKCIVLEAFLSSTLYTH